MNALRTAARFAVVGVLGLVPMSCGDSHQGLSPRSEQPFTQAAAEAVASPRRTPSFAAASAFDAGQGPTDVIAADFNGDGVPDLAVADSAESAVSVLLGRGDATFQAARSFSLDGPHAVSVAAGDFDGDHREDLVVTTLDPTTGTRTLLLLLGNGDGTFQPLSTLTTDASPAWVAVGDFNQDDLPDLVVADIDGGVTVLLGRGHDTFGPPKNFDHSLAATFVATGYFNHDRLLDLAVIDGTANTVNVLLGDGKGAFGPGTPYAQPSPVALVAADLQGGDLDDIAVANADNTVGVLLNNDHGGFTPGAQIATDGSAFLAAGYFDDDDLLDLAAVGGNRGVSVLLNQGHGTFTAGQRFASDFGAAGVVAADLDRDGRPDLAVANQGSDDVVVMRGSSHGTFVAARLLGNNPFSVTVGDFNGDQVPDLATSVAFGASVGLLIGNGDGTFQPEVSFPSPGDPTSIVSGDFNGDHLLDVAVANVGASSVSAGSLVNVLLNDGHGGFEAASSFPVGFVGLQSNAGTMIAADFNRDHALDLAVTSFEDGVVSVLLNKGDGSGSFEPYLAVSTGPGSQPVGLVAGDFNGDGVLDLVTPDTNVTAVIALLGNRDGSFGPPIRSPINAVYPYAVAAGDLNGDRVLDLAVVDPYSGLIVLLGNGDGTFQPLPTVPAGNQPVGVAIDDLDHDGHLDIAAFSNISDNILVFPGNGDGTFRPALSFKVGASDGLATNCFAVHDLDGDGLPDLVSVGDADLSVLFNTSR